jgi:hypothetical protein
VRSGVSSSGCASSNAVVALVNYFRVRLEPLSVETTFDGGVFVGDPLYTNIGGVVIEGSLVEVPVLDSAGLALMSLLLAGAAWIVLRRGSP